MSSYVPEKLRQRVTERAGSRCEYCRIPPTKPGLKHQIEHILPRKHGGETSFENLALSCVICNRYKGSEVGAFDLETGNLVPFFNPRTQEWAAHFRLENASIVPLTAEARVTVRILLINDAERIGERQELIEAGIYE